MKSAFTTLTFIIAGLVFASCGPNENRTTTASTTDSKVANTTEPAGNGHSLDTTAYEILTTDHQPAVENFHILIKSNKFDKAFLQEFIDKFRQEFCIGKCNISIYDDKGVKSLVTKYPLDDKEYLKVADHFVATSTFDMTDVWLYPFQDIKYKEMGGKNWKKEPIK